MALTVKNRGSLPPRPPKTCLPCCWTRTFRTNLWIVDKGRRYLAAEDEWLDRGEGPVAGGWPACALPPAAEYDPSAGKDRRHRTTPSGDHAFRAGFLREEPQ